MRLFGIPCGSSPINPLGCAPAGLKYRSRAMRQAMGSEVSRSRRIHSTINFEQPYGFVGPRGASSRIGTDEAAPYTVAEEENTNVPTPAPAIARHSTNAPCTLLS